MMQDEFAEKVKVKVKVTVARISQIESGKRNAP
jgi:hypothetical protein